MAHVSFEKVSKSFGRTVAIPELDLAIEQGEFVSLLGPSGCGKTTTLRMLAGLEQPSSGSIRIGEREVNDLPPGKRDIAMVFQSYALYPHMTVASNITYPLRKRGASKADQAERLRSVSEMLQIEALLDRRPKQLSGGQQQRVALARALVRDPEVFLLDEPLSNLDAKLRGHMRAELIELHRRLGKTMIYVTHDQLEAMTMSTRIAVMKDGVLQQFATPGEIYSQPANSFVASFIGTPSITMVDAEMSGGAVSLQLLAGIRIDLPFPVAASNSAKLLAGIRPEDVLVGQGPWTAPVRLAERAGHETVLILDIGEGLAARVSGNATFKIGERVAFDLRRDRILLFDRESGRRIELDTVQRPGAGRSGAS